MINPDIDLIEVGKWVFICAKNFLILEHNVVITIILKNDELVKL